MSTERWTRRFRLTVRGWRSRPSVKPAFATTYVTLTICDIDSREEREGESRAWWEAPVEGEQARVGERPWWRQSTLGRTREEEDGEQNQPTLHPDTQGPSIAGQVSKRSSRQGR